VTEVWLTIGALAVATAAIKAAGPVLLGGRALPPRAAAVIALLAPALLAALVVTETFGHGGRLVIDARAAGVAAAALAMTVRAPLVAAVVVAAVVTAGIRALG
jgi:uncharacterized membrane protein